MFVKIVRVFGRRNRRRSTPNNTPWAKSQSLAGHGQRSAAVATPNARFYVYCTHYNAHALVSPYVRCFFVVVPSVPIANNYARRTSTPSIDLTGGFNSVGRHISKCLMHNSRNSTHRITAVCVSVYNFRTLLIFN